MFPTLLPHTAIPVAGCASKASIGKGTTGIHIPGTPLDIDMEAAGNPVPNPAERWEEGSPHREVCETIEAIDTPDEDYTYVRDMVIDGNIPGGKGGK